MPDDELSSVPFPSSFTQPVKVAKEEDWEFGGVAIGDASQGLLVQLWHCTIGDGAVYVEAPSVAKAKLFDAPGVTDVALAFDQNMNPVVAYVQDGAAKYWWYDPTLEAMTFSDLPGATTPRCTLDDKRAFNTSGSDVILAYLKGRDLYFRKQRERYTVEYLLKTNAASGLSTVAMGTNNRLQFGVGEA